MHIDSGKARILHAILIDFSEVIDALEGFELTIISVFQVFGGDLDVHIRRNFLVEKGEYKGVGLIRLLAVISKRG